MEAVAKPKAARETPTNSPPSRQVPRKPKEWFCRGCARRMVPYQGAICEKCHGIVERVGVCQFDRRARKQLLIYIGATLGVMLALILVALARLA